MALVHCYECGEMISDRAPTCPKCGAPQVIAKTLVHCRECGELISENAKTCPSCGAPQGLRTYYSSSNTVDEPNVVLNVLSFLIPLVGLILYLVYQDKFPIKAKECGKWALIGFIVSLVISILIGIFAACTAASALGSLNSVLGSLDY